jgi:2-polyprenyl-6-hydroxyphenyl methylase/3-demethylubiquinone-9 3-methyltransferase
MQIKVKQFNTWERYYDSNHPKHKYQVARHDWFMDRVVGSKLLDIGCSGGLALFLAGKKENITELCGVDIKEDTTTTARERLSVYTDKKIDLRISQAESTGYDSNYFNCVIIGETLEHVPNDFNVLKEAFRVLIPTGILLVSVPKDGHLSREHIRLYSKRSIKDVITKAGFAIFEESEMRASKNGYYLLIKAIR